MANAKATETENVLVLCQNGMKELYSNTTSNNVRKSEKSFFWHAPKLLTVFVRILFFRGCMSCFYLTFYAELKAWMEAKKCLMTLEHKKEIRTCIIKLGFCVRNIQFYKNFLQFFYAFICLLFQKNVSSVN